MKEAGLDGFSIRFASDFKKLDGLGVHQNHDVVGLPIKILGRQDSRQGEKG